MPIVLLIVVGAAAGFLATRLLRIEAGIIPTMAVGMGGVIIGALVLRFLTSVMGLMAGFVGAVLGALLLAWLWKTYFRR
ncbi:GlsB/YeaQ/YmgE family stress response membrane protein [Rhodobacteraceae bacterium KMM 6894]|nr:GlsB/YeaQ/YmgE family stress response membrane protein [Rhodobacteraceae bacterium KMM 6894]